MLTSETWQTMTYTELVAAAKLYADRQDIEVNDSMDIFILMAEARVNRVLKTREQSTRAYTLTIEDKEYYPLPPDYSGMRDVQINSDLPTEEHKNTKLSYISPELFNTVRGKPYCGSSYYCVIANQIQIFPLQEEGKTIEMVYWQKVPNLNLTDSTNWLSESHPDIYLAGIVAEIEIFAKNYDVASKWDSKMSRSISELDESDVKENWSGSQLVTRIG